MESNNTTIPVDYVAIPIDEYAEMIRDCEMYVVLLDALEKAAFLSDFETHLEFNGEDVSTILQAIAPKMYFRTKRELKNDKAREEAKE